LAQLVTGKSVIQCFTPEFEHHTLRRGDHGQGRMRCDCLGCDAV
jgi:hypothetical protein